MLGNLLRQDDSISARGLDLKEARSFSESLFGPHSIHVIKPSRFNLVYKGHLLRSMSTTIGCLEHGTDISVAVADKGIPQTYNISLPVSGAQELRSARGIESSSISRGLVVSPEQEVVIDLSGDCCKIHVTISRLAVERVLSEILCKRVESLLVFNEGMEAAQGGAAAWWRMVKNFLAEVECAKRIDGCGYFSQEIETALIRCLLIAQPNNYSAQIETALGTRVPAYVLRSKCFIEANYRDPIHLEDIVAVAGVSRLKLFDSFRRHTGFTPVAYLKEVRLRHARAQLLLDGSSQNVSAIALSVGFNHLGRFSVDYKRAFFESPTETISRKTAR
ncbi:MAG: AraC family transcriptional regulator [Burkholderiaceae bacterium]|nr:AraC family transcriptional regulator [Burkholderiaceae bacterium]